jgi:hypothetical protein
VKALLNVPAFDALMRLVRPRMPRRIGLFEALAYPWVGSLEWLRRHALLIGELESIRQGAGVATLSVLDFGGGNGSLRHAMRLYGVTRHYRLTLADVDVEAVAAAPRDQSLLDAIVLDVSGPIPLDDMSIDVAVSSDVFEHIPPDARRYWIEELGRVSRLGQIHTFPADSEDGRWGSTAADRLFDAWYRDRYGFAERWTEEHLAHGEPSVEEMAGYLPGASTQGFANTSVWLAMVKNQFSAGFIGRCSFALRYLTTMRKVDSRPPFKGCLLLWLRQK